MASHALERIKGYMKQSEKYRLTIHLGKEAITNTYEAEADGLGVECVEWAR
jgi:hypothetical protein